MGPAPGGLFDAVVQFVTSVPSEGLARADAPCSATENAENTGN